MNDGCNECTCDGACTDMDCGRDWVPNGQCILCVDGYTLFNGECIDPTETCADDCSSWFDGCNNCFCEDGMVTGCTRMFCANYTEPYCRDTNDNATSTTTAAPTECEENGGYGCVSYFDGCNTCDCDGDTVSCTEMACTSLGEIACVECADGMTLENGECVMDTTTTEEPENPSDANIFGIMVGFGFVFSLFSWM